jgi:tetratricopeptide (TPR) repeat protein
MRNLGRMATLTAALLLLASASFLVRSNLSGISTTDPAAISAPTESATDRLISSLQQRLTGSPDDAGSLTQLGFAYLQKAREAGDPVYYGKADGVLQKALAAQPQDAQALTGMSSVALARHDFPGALNWGQQALSAAPGGPDSYAAVGDAYIELGRYDEAVDAFQKMVNLRPDLASYSRVSYARELHGDVAGGIQAMQLAVEAGGPLRENAAWVRYQLGNLYFNSGDLTAAAQQYDRSLLAFPGFVHALAGQAKVAAARGDFSGAAGLYQQVTVRYPIPDYVAGYGDVLAAAGQPEQAQRQYDLVGAIDQLYAANGVNTDLQTALFFSDHNRQLDEALTQARALYQRQPGSISAADALAWSLYKNGQYPEAAAHSQEALRLGTQDAALFFHAGMIAKAQGEDVQAQGYLAKALAINPHFSVLNAPIAAQALAELGP